MPILGFARKMQLSRVVAMQAGDLGTKEPCQNGRSGVLMEPQCLTA